MRDTARLSQRYPPIARYGVFGVSTWPIGCDTPSPFSERIPLGEHAKGRCDIPPPPPKGVSQQYLRDTLWKQGKWVRYPPLRYYLERYCTIGGGGISHWAAKSRSKWGTKAQSWHNAARLDFMSWNHCGGLGLVRSRESDSGPWSWISNGLTQDHGWTNRDMKSGELVRKGGWKQCVGSNSRTKNQPKQQVSGTDIPRTFGGHARGYPGQKLRWGQSKSWKKNKHVGADIHDPKARTSTTT